MKMVHTRNGNNHLVQPYGCEQGRGKTKARPGKSSSRKRFLEDARVALHFPRSLPTNFDVNSDPEPIQGNISSSEPLLSGSHRNISVPLQKLIQSSQGRGVGNMPKSLAGGYELLLTHQELSGTGEDHRTLRRMEPIFCMEKVEKIKNWLKNQTLLSVDQNKKLEMTPALEKEVPVVSTSSRSVQRQAQGTSE
ncbi:hypothetical protein O181_046098 [Austropuccinia psidii MF-1]|uniref:Uncharacterized protein n=1 Tax=Austropuccinia psidii MF-1 TaxID=1389203 RepID=A0A9Q3DTC9_9BASI|nr:hypothetical protein [Austropuccinia psidii MF-1]